MLGDGKRRGAWRFVALVLSTENGAGALDIRAVEVRGYRLGRGYFVLDKYGGEDIMV